MYVIIDDKSGTTYYFSYWNKWGMPVYTPELNKARLYETRKEASFDKQKNDKIIKLKER